MSYAQVSEKERYYISWALGEGVPLTRIAHKLGRSRSTIHREIVRNRDCRGHYKPLIAHGSAEFRKRDSRRKSYFTEAEWAEVFKQIRFDLAPEQAAGRLALTGVVKMHLTTIYREIKRNKQRGGLLFKHLRQAHRKKRKRYGTPENRGVLKGKRNISERPREANERSEIGHCEADLVRGHGGFGWVLTLVERRTRLARVRKLDGKSVEEINRKLIPIIRDLGAKTITVDNGCEFHGYKTVEGATGVQFYFANPHRSWERGSIENLNGLIRQYLPKWMPLNDLTQAKCNFIEDRLNRRPRKTLNYKTPEECYYGL